MMINMNDKNKLNKNKQNKNIKKINIEEIKNKALIYELKQDYKNMIKYHLMAIELNDIDSMIDLGNYYDEIDDIENMKKYYFGIKI